MKKFRTKPVLAVVAAAAIAGGLAPLWADASSAGDGSAKVVMNEEGKQVTRYNLKELAENDPATLNLLLKTQAEHLYIVVDEINLDAKMTTFIEQRKEEWEKIYAEHYEDIYLEVRLDETSEGFVSVKAETRDDKTYITGEVTDDVTKVVVAKENGDKYEVKPSSDDTFTVSFAAVMSAVPQSVTVKAYVGSKLVESKEMEINKGTAEKEDAIVHTLATLDASKQELKVKGIVSLEADDVYVTYDGVRKEVDAKKLWEGVGSFGVTFTNATDEQESVLVEAYKDGEKIDSERIDVVTVNEPEQPAASEYEISGTAVISAKYKTILVKGKIGKHGSMEKAKLFVTAPDGRKHEVKLSGNQEFEAQLSYQNRSFSSKAVRVELYVDGKLVAQKDIPHGTPVNVQPVTPVPAQPVKATVEVKGKEKGKGQDKKEKHKGKGHAYGHLKGSKLEIELEIEHEKDRDRDDDHDREKNDD